MNIIAVKNPKYLSRYCHSSIIGIPTEFWVAKKEAFPEGAAPTLLYKDGNELMEMTISDNPKLIKAGADDENSMLFKLVRRSVIRLKDELLQIWNGAHADDVLFNAGKFPSYWEMTDEQQEKLQSLNKRLLDVEKSLYEKCEQIRKDHSEGELSCGIDFLLQENDPEWSDEDDNIMASIDHAIDEYDPNASWNDAPHLIREKDGQPLHLCWLFHELYDHLGLAWEDLLRVGKIRVTVNASYDYEY
jgi:hypothetical protein